MVLVLLLIPIVAVVGHVVTFVVVDALALVALIDAAETCYMPQLVGTRGKY